MGTPTTSATSASPNALDRARENARSWSACYGPACHAVHQHRNAQRLSQIQQCGLCVSPPHVGARHDYGPPGSGEQPHGGVDGVAVRADHGGQALSAHRVLLVVMGLTEHVVHGEVDERHPRRRPVGARRRP